MLIILFMLPIALCLVSLTFRNKSLNRALLAVFAAVYALAAVSLIAGWELPLPALPFAEYFTFDSLGKLLLLILAAVNAGVSGYSLFYLKAKNLDRKHDTIYTIFLLLFLVAMTGGALATHLGLLWVFIEATTLAGGMLISVEREKSALEAVWKYIFVCSIGVAFSFIGIIVLSLGSKAVGSLFFADLYGGAGKINPLLLKLAFAFILAGFGTKMGLAPVHAWLPDAHSEAPAPVSALLSGALLNIAAVGLVRFYPVMAGAGLEPFAGVLLLVMGFLSLLVSAAFILASKNYKRMLAYSSIENMGLIAIGLGLGGPGLFAALLHMAVHSLAKSGLFLTSGNIYHLIHSKRMEDARGLLRRDKASGWLWVLGFVALAGLPPFGAFISKFYLVQAMVERGLAWLLIPFFLLIVMVVWGMGRSVFGMAWGSGPEVPAAVGAPVKPGRLPVMAYAPGVFFLLLLLVLGVCLPDFFVRLLSDVQRTFTIVGVKP